MQDAKAAIDEARARQLNSSWLHICQYLIDFQQRDTQGMEREAGSHAAIFWYCGAVIPNMPSGLASRIWLQAASLSYGDLDTMSGRPSLDALRTSATRLLRIAYRLKGAWTIRPELL